MPLKNDLFHVCKILLFYGGSWTQDTPSHWSKYRKATYWAYAFTCHVFYMSILPLFMVELSRVVGKDLDAAIASLKILTFVSVVAAKLVILRSKNVKKLIDVIWKEAETVSSSNDPEIKEIYREHTIYCHMIAAVIVFCFYLGGVIYIGDALYRTYLLYKTEENVTDDTPKPHPIQVWFPFDKNKYYKLAMAYQIMHITQSLNFSGALQVLTNSVMIFFKAKLRILQYMLRNTHPNLRGNVLRVSALRHQKLIRWINDFNTSFQYVILLEYCVTSLQLATILVDFLQGRKIIFNAQYFVMTTVQLFTMAWNANEILYESSLELSYAIYFCPWYLMDKASKTSVEIMIGRCNRPVSIHIGPFGFMTLHAALSRMKLAYSVVSVLSTSIN